LHLSELSFHRTYLLLSLRQVSTQLLVLCGEFVDAGGEVGSAEPVEFLPEVALDRGFEAGAFLAEPGVVLAD
jgi:hypothetical protein